MLDAVVNISTSQTIDAGKAMQMPQVPPGSPFEEFFDEFFKRRGEGNTPRDRWHSPRVSGKVIGTIRQVAAKKFICSFSTERHGRACLA